jgi:uncharacterized membrane protein YsdA (DUF1294 family)/cold shock CspA family protein
MRGCVSDWKDDRGFGFIEPESGDERVFFHISSVVRGAPRPSVGDLVSYGMSVSPDGKARAVWVGPAGLAAVSKALMSKRVALSVAAILVFLVLWWLVTLSKFPLLLFWAFAGISSVAFIMYGLDKRAAQSEAQRIPESTLQFCALLGGWPGALLAQQVFRHKSSKRSFQVKFWFIVVLNCCAIWFLISPTGAAFIRKLLESLRG